MTEAKHTPGPWGSIDGAEIYPLTGPNAQVALARVVGTPGTESDFYGPEEAAANSRLVIAAPDLLAACELLDLAAELFRAGKRDGGTMGQISIAMDAARAAIAKAKGGA